MAPKGLKRLDDVFIAKKDSAEAKEPKRDEGKLIPELIWPASWKFKDGYQGSIDMKAKIIYREGKSYSEKTKKQKEAYRTRDYLSLAYTPSDAIKRGQSGDMKNMISLLESHRLKCIGMHRGLTDTKQLLSTPLKHIGKKIEAASKYSLNMKYTTYIQLQHVDGVDKPLEEVGSEIEPKVKEAIDSVLRNIEHGMYLFDGVKKGAKNLLKLFHVESYDDVQEQMNLVTPKGSGRVAPKGDEEVKAEELPGGASPPESGEWGKVQVVDVPLTEKVVVKKERSKKRKVTDMGMSFTRPDRICTDMMVFSRRKKEKRKGTILIDMSGSMHINPNDVVKIAEISAGVKVATYSGYEDRRGYFRTIVDKGKHGSHRDMTRHRGGNEIDIPCLAWLAKQAEPRIWVSDGGISGPYELAQKIVDKGKITQVPDLETIINMLEGETVNLDDCHYDIPFNRVR